MEAQTGEIKKKKGAPCLSMRHEPRSGKERREGVNFE